MNFKIREMKKEDYDGVAEIYGQGIESGTATFRTKTPQFEEWDGSHLPFCRYIAEQEGLIIGWTALSLALGISRGAYRGVAELSIYVRDGYRRHGVGFALIERVKAEAESCGIWTLESRICRQNTGSVRLHEKCGFRTVGVRERIARDRFGEWQDTVEMEYRL
ncbi:MAG: GNAT family N-acetyltransferase [Bacteroides sp.]|nr:GNAT family N-acetyltransferase [Bacteroides sp.]